MANIVFHTELEIHLDVTAVNSGDPEMLRRWTVLYHLDKTDSANGIRVADRGLRCAGVWEQAGVTAWMHLRETRDATKPSTSTRKTRPGTPRP
ncbi:hypothetical protein AR457_39895 [Streptomyces agglomeratus]|nr:hypothetical protein AR457_38575 [Streptomyces agglomeratus]OEJ22059.1 hypothetical protein AR457_39895 [Streptomyces agglomeratus]OEJ36896.1 hypothetical protein BGK70_00550 [Streptomyces agglomeratus]